MTEPDIATAAAYQAAHQQAILVDRSELGMLKFTGQTRLDLINRMSTQKVINLRSGEGAATVLTSDIGRIIDRLILYAAGEAVYCLTGENNGAEIAAYLRRFIFFRDDFQIEDLSAETAVLAVYGARAQTLLAELVGDPLEFPLHHWRELVLDARTIYIHRTDPIAGGGFFVMAQATDREALWARLAAAGISPADEASFEYLRIESGQPRFGHELTLDYIPLEANLWADVSFTKGCYTGQEIIARMESRGQLAKRLVRLGSAIVLAPGSELIANGKKAGTVTSAADGPQGPLALGYIRTALLAEGPGQLPDLNVADVPVTVLPES